MLMSCVDLNLNPLSEGSSENWYSSQAEIEMSLNDFYRTDFFPIDDMKWGDDVTARNETSAVNIDFRRRNDCQTLGKLL